MSSINCNINIFDIYAKEGNIEQLKIIKNEYPNIVCTIKGYTWATMNFHIDVIKFIDIFFPLLRNDFIQWYLTISSIARNVNYVLEGMAGLKYAN
jgi:hypothetical protein